MHICFTLLINSGYKLSRENRKLYSLKKKRKEKKGNCSII